MKIGLALSGGGARAAVFHLGVMRRLACDGHLEDVTAISTVSGGSLVAAAIFSHCGLCWPSSKQFKEVVYPALREIITTRDLLSFRALGWRGALALHVRVLTQRARILADLLERQWGVRGALVDLPECPKWQINATCIESGKNWRFSRREMGDWAFGKHYLPPFSLAEAAAASAAVPYAIGALKLRLPDDGWFITDPATRKPLRKAAAPNGTVRLWDGGVYENLGLEALFKPGRPLEGCDFLVCSDASGPLPAARKFPLWGVLRGHLVPPRLFDIASDQIRSLRSRMFVDALQRGDAEGCLIRMGNSVKEVDIKSGRERAAAEYDRFQADMEAAVALRYPTDLKALSVDDFDRIARHGHEVADVTLTAHAAERFPRSVGWG